MSRQIAVVMTEKDERRFLAHLRATADIQIMRTRAAAPASFAVDEFPPRASGEMQFVVWNKAFAWEPQIEPASDGSYYLARYSRGSASSTKRMWRSHRASSPKS